MSLPVLNRDSGSEVEVLEEELEQVTLELKKYIRGICRTAPPEPCMEEPHYFDVPVSAWQEALDEWCEKKLRRNQAYSHDWVRGLREAIRDFDDDQLLAFIEGLAE